MTFSLTQLSLLIVGYLSLLFGVGFAADRGKIPRRILEHPAVYVLSLGVFAGAMGIFGATEFAYYYGNHFLLCSIGVAVMFLLSPLILSPLLKTCRTYQLGSLADLLAFRFQSPAVGTLVTLGLLLAVLPLLALQIKAVSNSIHILYDESIFPITGSERHQSLALLFCLTIALFAMMFGTRNPSSQPRHQGLVAAIAFESLVKLAAMLCLGIAAIYSVFGGFSELQLWLESSPQIAALADSPLRQDSSRALLVIFFAGAVTMPHLFHMSFAENPGRGFLGTASWGLPLYLLLLALPVLPLTWASYKLGSNLPPAYSVISIGISQKSTLMSTAGFIAGLSAASAVVIVSTLAMANMCLNHIVLPARLHTASRRQSQQTNLYEQLTWLRRVLAAAIILLGLLFYWLTEEQSSLVSLGLVAFIGTLQFFPAILATLFWPKANRQGLLAGLAAGFLVWFPALLWPMISDFEPKFLEQWYWFAETENTWSAATVVSMASNIALFIAVSMLTRTSDVEKHIAAVCSMDNIDRPLRSRLSLTSPAEYEAALAAELGNRIAAEEVQRALRGLHMPESENRPIALRRLREQIAANLSGMLGPTVATEIIQRAIPYRTDNTRQPEDLSQIESNLDRKQSQFTGLAADLNSLRRHHRETLQELPIGVFSLGVDGEVLLWNRFMEEITGVKAAAVIGSLLESLPLQWANLLLKFANSEKSSAHGLPLPNQGAIEQNSGHWINLHKSTIDSSSRVSVDRLIVVEDVTNYRVLEQELLHSERLASVGRLAAGVAHEIGNPVTGIACLAQNLAFEEDADEVKNAASEILTQTDRITRILESLVKFSHVGKNNLEQSELVATNLADCVDEAIHLLQLDHRARPVAFTNNCDREHLVLADSQKLLQVFINLLGNARDASNDGQSVDVDSHSGETNVAITVTDSGSGIADNIKDQIFEPFFTTKDTGFGTGLGLALVYSILEDMNGRIQVTSPVSNSRGTCVELLLQPAQYADEYL